MESVAEAWRDTGLESIPVGIARIERSQEGARDPRQKTINTDFANSYIPPKRRVALVHRAQAHTSFRSDRWRRRTTATPPCTCA